MPPAASPGSGAPVDDDPRRVGRGVGTEERGGEIASDAVAVEDAHALDPDQWR